MALPYKLLKTITIDGTTMGVDDTVGVITSATKNINVPATGVTTNGATVTVPEDGTYIVTARAYYPSGATVTYTYRTVSIWKGNGEFLNANGAVDYSNQALYRNVAGMCQANKNDTILIACAATYAFNNVQTQVSIVKVPSYE